MIYKYLMTIKTIKLSLLFYVLSMPFINAQHVVKPLSDNKISLFPLSDVRITEGQFRHIENLSHAYLLTLEPDRLLSWFRREAGLTPKGQPYPLWESEDFQSTGPLSGHIMGFYLSSMSMLYQTTSDSKVLDRLKYTLAGLKEVQDTHGDGYLLAQRTARHTFEDVVAGNFRTSNPMINDTWEPVYIMNKIMLGLYNAYTLCGLEEAKPILVKMADWFGNTVIEHLTHEDMQKLLVCEHGSINESFIDVYKVTGDTKYLKWAEKLNDEDMWVPLSKGEDILQGWHANTQIPKFTGFTAVYRYNGNKDMYNAANLFWDIVVSKHTWINGGNSSGERFFTENDFERRVPNNGGPESCNSVNMMRLTEALYQTDGAAKRVDYYERVLFNHILANFDPENAMCVYYTSMRPGHYKVHASPYNSFWCCVGTGLEAPTKFAKMIYAYNSNSLYVNMFIPSTLIWKEKGVKLEQNTLYPDQNNTMLTFKTEGTIVNFDLKVRNPFWVKKNSLTIKINGKNFKANHTDDGYMCVSREWLDGDKIEISFEPELKVEPLKDSKLYYSATYGAIVLGSMVDNHGLTREDFSNPTRTVGSKNIPLSKTPIFVGTPEKIQSSIKKNSGNKLSFSYNNPVSGEITLIPFNRIHFHRYAIYFMRFDNAQQFAGLIDKENAFEKKLDLLKNISIDAVNIGDTESEKAHKIEFVRSNTGSYNSMRWRDARTGGYFMYNLRSLPDEKLALFVIFRTDDSGSRLFDLLVDGKMVTTFDNSKPKEGIDTPLYSVVVPIPEELTKGKYDITVKFQARNRNSAGGLFDIRLIKVSDSKNLSDI